MCQSSQNEEAGDRQEVITLLEGDVISVTFTGAEELNGNHQIRRDGRISLPLVGEVVVLGKTPEELESELLTLYEDQLVTNDVRVSVVSSSYSVFVQGAVLSPGKVVSNRPLTVLEAIMEAGGYDASRANLKKVQIIRNENGKLKHYRVNLKEIIQGKSAKQFYVKPSDIIIVPEKFTWV